MGNAKSIANSIIFPAPEASYDHTLPDLIWIPKRFAGRTSNGNKISSGSFPVLFLKSPKPSSLFFIYLHANCCDIGLIKPELYEIVEGVGASIIAVEYPGYGISPEIQVTNGPSIDLRVIATFYFLLSLGVQPSSIVFFGRSIGTGPAACVASHFVKKGIMCGGVILQAPYVSIHKIVQEYFPLGSWLIDNFWDTEQALKDMSPSVPLLIIHGLLDEIVPVAHGQRLFDGYTSEFKMADFQPNSKHNYYSIKYDLVEPIIRFVNQFNISLNNPPVEIILPNWCYFNSKGIMRKKKQTDSQRSTSTNSNAKSISNNNTNLNSNNNTNTNSNNSSQPNSMLSSSRSIGTRFSRSTSIQSNHQMTTARSNLTASARLQESNNPDLGSDVNRNICYNNFSSSLEGLCQRNSINSEDISEIVNEAISRNNSSQM